MTVSTLVDTGGLDAVTVLVTVTAEADRVTVIGSFLLIVTVLIVSFVTVVGVGQTGLCAAGVTFDELFCALTTAKKGRIATTYLTKCILMLFDRGISCPFIQTLDPSDRGATYF